MITKDYGKYTLVCDTCGVATDDKFETFQDVVDVKDEIGWKSKRLDGEWVDVCPDCIE